MVEVAAERGAANVTVAHVVARSGVSRRTFYEQFEDREQCFLAAFDDAVQRIAAVVLPAYERSIGWREQIRGGLCALLEFLDQDRVTGRLVFVEVLGAGPKALEHRRRIVEKVIAAVDKAREEPGKDGGPPTLTAEGVVGGGFSLIHARLLESEQGPLVELLNPLMAMIVLPYQGSSAARKELERPTPVVRTNGKRSGSDPLRDLEMRLTYRTICVLLAIGSNPDASNRKVADASGIRDQGQVSKLLSRLEHLGLVQKAEEHPAKGEPNAWRLTERGADVRGAISRQGIAPS
jgi:AcrR family transcriptional regulator